MLREIIFSLRVSPVHRNACVSLRVSSEVPASLCLRSEEQCIMSGPLSQGSDLDNITGMASSRPVPAGAIAPSGLGSTLDTCRGDTTPNVSTHGHAERLQRSGTGSGLNSSLSHASGSGTFFRDSIKWKSKTTALRKSQRSTHLWGSSNMCGCQWDLHHRHRRSCESSTPPYEDYPRASHWRMWIVECWP